ncbi:MAG TPA: hypothetical protein VJQ55_17105, partial [Candidatus Binatia bacterium]|nr:hypothetical protein [Candidatus Binatia bacterium]
MFVWINTTRQFTKGDHLMKRFLGILVASMFLASAAYAGEAMKEEKKDAKASEKKSDSKAAEKKTDGKAKAGETKGGAMGDAQAGDKKAG